MRRPGTAHSSARRPGKGGKCRAVAESLSRAADEGREVKAIGRPAGTPRRPRRQTTVAPARLAEWGLSSGPPAQTGRPKSHCYRAELERSRLFGRPGRRGADSASPTATSGHRPLRPQAGAPRPNDRPSGLGPGLSGPASRGNADVDAIPARPRRRHRRSSRLRTPPPSRRSGPAGCPSIGPARIGAFHRTSTEPPVQKRGEESWAIGQYGSGAVRQYRGRAMRYRVRVSSSGYQAPKTGKRAHRPRTIQSRVRAFSSVLGAQCPALGVGPGQVLGIRYQVPGSWYLIPGTQDLGPAP